MRKAKSRPWPVTVTLQVGDAEGNVVEVKQGFVLNFTPLSEKEVQQIIDEETLRGKVVVKALEILEEVDAAAAGQPLPPPAPSTSSVHEMLDLNSRIFTRLVDGWSKVMDEDKKPIPYSSATLAAMITGLDGLAISTGINQARMQMLYGMAPAKNAATSPAPGPEASADGAAPTK